MLVRPREEFRLRRTGRLAGCVVELATIGTLSLQ